MDTRDTWVKRGMAMGSQTEMIARADTGGTAAGEETVSMEGSAVGTAEVKSAGSEDTMEEMGDLAGVKGPIQTPQYPKTYGIISAAIRPTPEEVG